MFVLIWANLILSVRSSDADTGAAVWGRKLTNCQGAYCITLSEGEITAEAGLCVMIPCSFTAASGVVPQHIVWYKCQPSKQKCGDPDIIFHTNNVNNKVQSGFRGRVSLLEPDVRQMNCSIFINELTESDSGAYQLRVNGLLNRQQNGFTFSTRSNVSVKALTQKPTVKIPPLTEGQQTTLTCIAPGLCSGSHPKITWMWRGAGEEDSHITGNKTAFMTENVTAVIQRHGSTLTFNPSAEHHGTSVTCKVSFTGNITTEETVTLNVTYVKEVKITGNTSVKEGETLNLTCSVESFPPALITWTIFSEENMQNDTLSGLQNVIETFPQEESGMSTLSISNMTANNSGRYICTAKHLNNALTEKIDVTVIYMKTPAITGNTTVKEGDALNLTCSVESFPPSHITWTAHGSNTNLHSGSDTDLQNDTGSASLLIPNVTAEHTGQYICTAQHLATTVYAYADVTVTWFSMIQENSACELQSDVLTCACICEGFPLPTIKWPLLKNHAEYSVITAVSNHTVNSTISLTIKDHSNTSVECVSSHENGEARKNLSIRENTPEPADLSQDILKVVSRLEVIVAFFFGVLLSAVLCCLAKKCPRKKHKAFRNLGETLEMVTSQDDPLIYAGQAEEDDQTYYQDAAEGGGAVAAENATLDLNGGPKDVAYASIDFSKLKRKNLRQAEKQETTEYAEIKKELKEEREDDGGEEDEVLEVKEEEEEVEEEVEEEEEEEVVEEVVEDEETEQFVPKEEEGEDMAVYSNVKDIMGEI